MKRCVLAITLLAVAHAARATTMAPLDLKALTERADRVVLGTVESSVARWTDSHDAIFTETTVRVGRAYKGSAKAGERVIVRHEGGSVDGIGMRVFGAAHFSVGEEVVVFVEQRGAASYVVGMAQGKLHVVTQSDGKKTVAADLSGIQLTTAAPAPLPRALEDLEREIRACARSAR